MDLRNRELISHSNVSKWRFLPTIAAERVMLRWIDEADESALYEMFSDPEVMRYWSSAPLKARDEARRLVLRIHEGFHSRRFFQWGIARETDNRIIGTATLFYLDSNNLRAEIGYALVRREWGKGYMREALQALLGFAFQELSLQRIEADVDPRNVASSKLLRTLGFKQEGVLRERWRATGEVQDSVIYGLLRREWNGCESHYRILSTNNDAAPIPPRVRSDKLPRSRYFYRIVKRPFGAVSSHVAGCLRLIAAMFD